MNRRNFCKLIPIAAVVPLAAGRFQGTHPEKIEEHTMNADTSKPTPVHWTFDHDAPSRVLMHDGTDFNIMPSPREMLTQYFNEAKS